MSKTYMFTKEQMLDGIEKGITKVGTARVLGCHTETVRRYARKYKVVYEALESKRSELVDLAELGLRKAIMNNEGWAIAFTLKTLGKNEGYTERQEFTGANGVPIRFIVEKDADAANE